MLQSIVVLVATLIFGLITKFLPSFPLAQEAFIGLVVWVVGLFIKEVTITRAGVKKYGEKFWKR